jgi:hypothetical protein
MRGVNVNYGMGRVNVYGVGCEPVYGYVNAPAPGEA